jgi:DUF4097 and DUF4098 domain-containing protein YvlB
LIDIRNSRLDIQSVSGNIRLHSVTRSLLKAHSGSGQITYDGDPGPTGEYVLSTSSGDLEVSIPAKASVEIQSHSMRGEPDPSLVDRGSNALRLALFQR